MPSGPGRGESDEGRVELADQPLAWTTRCQRRASHNPITSVRSTGLTCCNPRLWAGDDHRAGTAGPLPRADLTDSVVRTMSALHWRSSLAHLIQPEPLPSIASVD